MTTPYPVTPLIELSGDDAAAWDGQFLPNRSAATSPTRNAIDLNSGDIRSAAMGGLTITKNYATGPSGVGTTAERVQFAAVSNAFLLYSGINPPAGNYRWKVQVRLNAGQGTKNLRYGNLAAGLTTIPISDAAWTPITLDFTASGGNYNSLALYPGIGAAVPFDLLIDEVQLYNLADGTIPPFTDEAHGWHMKAISAAFHGRLATAGNALDNATGGAVGKCVAPEYPGTRNFTELTVFATIKYETGANGQVIVTETDAALGTTVNTFNLGVSSTGALTLQPINAGTTNVNILGQGWHIVGIRLSAAARAAYFHEIELNRNTTAWAGFDARLLCIGGQTTATPFKGKIGLINVWDAALSDTDVTTVVTCMRERVALLGESMGAFSNFYIAEGDSRTALTGTSYAFSLGNAGEFTPNLYMRNFAVSGSVIADLNTRLPAVQKVAAQAQLNGRRLILSVMIGINDNAWIVANGASSYYNTYLKPLWAAYRATGAKLIVCTELPDNGTTVGYDTQRLALNTLIRGDITQYDALCDFASDSIMGITNSRSTNPSYWTDNYHPNAAGHVLLKPYMKTAIEGLLV